jgi:hypothetical protein
MATTEKLSLTLENEVLAWARKEAKRAKVSLSALVSEQLRAAQRRQAWDEYLKEALDGKPFTLAEREQATRVFAQLAQGQSVRVSIPKRARRAAAR